MTPRPLAFTDTRMSLVLTTARSVPPTWRTRFLESIAARLLVLDAIADADVQAAATDALDRPVTRPPNVSVGS
jgi:hypothetical protein